MTVLFCACRRAANRVGRSARLYFRSPESSLIKYCRGGSLRPPARLQQSRFRAMKEKAKSNCLRDSPRVGTRREFAARRHVPQDWENNCADSGLRKKKQNQTTYANSMCPAARGQPQGLSLRFDKTCFRVWEGKILSRYLLEFGARRPVQVFVEI